MGDFDADLNDDFNGYSTGREWLRIVIPDFPPPPNIGRQRT
jgi:hypothetical protein